MSICVLNPAVVISHNHYDHMDLPTLQALPQDAQYYVPLRNKQWFNTNLPGHKVIEADWWDTFTLDGLEITCTPCQHFTGRSLFDNFKTLWSSWVIQSDTKKFYFAGY